MSEQEFDPVAQMGHDGAEIKRLRARIAELEALLTDANEFVAECNGFALRDRIDAALEKR